MRGNRVSQRALVRHCSLVLLVLGVLSPIVVLLGTGGLPTLKRSDAIVHLETAAPGKAHTGVAHRRRRRLGTRSLTVCL
jgi:hypothetical protein